MSEVDPRIRKRVERGIQAISPYEATWQTCLSFFDNDQYVELSAT